MTAREPAPRWAGELWMARDFVLMQGRAAATEAHAHYAHQLLLSAGAPLTVQLDDQRLSGTSLLIESMREHAVVEALAQIDQQLAGKVEAGELASGVNLSLSQLERLFSAELGLSIRRMVRWRRLRLALALALQGAPLTTAAHEAGFADSAHLSRTMREMFGVRADRLLQGMRLRLID